MPRRLINALRNESGDQMKERIGYFDSAKAILITMVVVGHILNYANPRLQHFAVYFGAEFYYVVPYVGFLCGFRYSC